MVTCLIDYHSYQTLICTDEMWLLQAVYFYQPEERGQCLAFEGEKLQLHWYHGYMIIVGKENQPLPRSYVDMMI